jgi:hypothetical protein
VAKLRLSLKRDEALRTTRVAIGKNKLVYVLIADKRLSYKSGKSRVAYIGTTKKGVARIAQSAAGRAEAILNLRGVRAFHVRVITCKSRQNVKTWRKLERAMLLCFRERFGEIPECNTQGSKMKETDEFEYFSRTAVKNVIEELS